MCKDLPVGRPGADRSLLEIGDFVLATGNPFRIGQTVTSGIISGLHQLLKYGEVRRGRLGITFADATGPWNRSVTPRGCRRGTCGRKDR
jgi:S1-C subfamily serine protease